ncbi:hypothetical protein DSCW_26120 [Desulfosarcina widdelii]|uniref:Uncharacterized protein n=1 Tax=Desulfosarcina widdelii TaxID=947919 RepID=A0A5K7Z3A7_9BACT|nr:hypothetical protein [Desulfosarcina widdelii]BBO75195.1 hypothetical protein DSCW_26120 [Desulfosarcina widdelii]
MDLNNDLNSEQQKIADMLGVTAEDIRKYGGGDTDLNTGLNAEQRNIADMFGKSAEDIRRYGMEGVNSRSPEGPLAQEVR